MKKYELLTNVTIEILGVTLYRIRALIDFGDVECGEFGGYEDYYQGTIYIPLQNRKYLAFDYNC